MLPVREKKPHLVASLPWKAVHGKTPLPWKRLWPVLEAKGWRVTNGSKQYGSRMFYPPSARLDTATGTPAKCFNSMKSVRAHLRETVPDPVAFLAALPPGKNAECTYKNAEYTAPTIRPSYGGTDSTGHGYIGELDGRNHITMPGDSRPGKQRILSSSSLFHTGMKIFPPQGKLPQPPGMHVVPAGISQHQWDRELNREFAATCGASAYGMVMRESEQKLASPQLHQKRPPISSTASSSTSLTSSVQPETNTQATRPIGQPPPGDPLMAGCEGTEAGELDADDADQMQNEMDSNDYHDDDHEDDKNVGGRMRPRKEAKGALNMMCTK